jgi:hypothetical protein
MKYVVIGALWGLSIYYLTGDAFEEGYMQGYFEGKASVTQTEQQVFLQCTEWWFNGSESRAKQAINQYCDRRIK